MNVPARLVLLSLIGNRAIGEREIYKIHLPQPILIGGEKRQIIFEMLYELIESII